MNSDHHDVVVVGAGSAGAVLAARLSEDPDRSVLLLEAGSDADTAHTEPSVRSPNFFDGIMTPGRLWPSLVATRASGQEPSLYARGRGMGGSSAINAMLGLRGTPDDYDRWADDLGCPDWGWPMMRAAFLAIEDDADYGGDGHHGKGGPIPLERVPHDALPPFDRAMRAAALAAGYPEHDACHAPGATGLSRAPLTLRDGKRVSVNDAYLDAARARPNLSVRGDVLVDRVALDGTRAVGVWTANGEEIGASEVIVSAGAIHSPALLLRSGIGGAGGLPVGQHLKDHNATPGFEVALRSDGRVTEPHRPIIGSMIRFTSGSWDGGLNDLQIVWFSDVGAGPDAPAGARVFGAVMRPFSEGAVRLRSDDPHDDPTVDFNMLSDERDRVRLRLVVQRILELVRDPSVGAISESVTALTTPIDELDSDDAIDAWLAANVTDYVHAAGTCAMGKVVDTDCRVIGYEGLRVCDASVMPDLPKANTHLTTVAIAEHLSARIAR